MATCGTTNIDSIDGLPSFNAILGALESATGFSLGSGGNLNPPGGGGGGTFGADLLATIETMCAAAAGTGGAASIDTFDGSDLPAFTIPDPVPGGVTVTYSGPDEVDASELTPIPAANYTEDPPEFTEAEPTYNAGVTPGSLYAQAPDEPDMDTWTVPTNPGISLPTAPTLDTPSFPAAPTLTIPTFSAQAPNLTITTPVADGGYDDADYSSDLLTKLQAQMATWLAGGVGFPDAIWSVLESVYLSRVSDINARAASEATIEWSSRGWEDIDYVLGWREQEATQRGQNVMNRHRRSVAITQAQLQMMNLRDAIAYGMALEQVLVSIWDQRNTRLLAAASTAVEVALMLMNAAISVYNARVREYEVKARVWRTQIEAEMERLSANRAEIEAQKALAQVNLQVVQNYAIGVSAVEAEITAYRAYVQGLQAQSDMNQATVEQYRGQIDAFEASVRAFSAEWDGYAGRVRGETAKLGFFESLAQAFARRIQAHTASIEGESQKVQTGLRIATTNADMTNTRAQAANTEGANILGDIDAQAANATLRISEEQARLAQIRAKNSVDTSSGQARAQLMGESVSHEYQRIRQMANLLREQTQAVIRAGEIGQRALAQVGAASWQAVNLSMTGSMGFGSSNGRSCSWSFEGN